MLYLSSLDGQFDSDNHDDPYNYRVIQRGNIIGDFEKFLI